MSCETLHVDVGEEEQLDVRSVVKDLVYDAPVMQPLNHLNKAIAHPALKLRACNAN
jgi:hypothetical protein